MKGYLPFRTTDSHLLVRVEPAEGGDWTHADTMLLSEFVGGLVLERMRRYEKMRIAGSTASLAVAASSLHRPSLGWHPL
ncbi:hypothetical protein BOTBODRAFT_589792 [Botryobasidium botryosum FD-172 SS1]|uniref:Uncharacterized protein n=1 Tax=Botryobasidium botryosum (strain FD-172 SS1) TaxID=930990 RepID=A0A067M7W6_BOTB1|nr:hypothetical protein BOTBODRAFT_589792 [Botryobasidium botryosum FD-172 SS1]